MVTALTLMLLGQLSTPPIFPADTGPDAPPPAPQLIPPPPPMPPPAFTPSPVRSARLMPEADATPGQIAARAFLSPVLVLGIGILAVPLSLYAGAIIGVAVDPSQGESLGAGIGAIVGAAASFVLGSAVSASLFSRDTSGFKRALPWAIGGAVISTVGICLMFFVPAVGLAALPFVVGGAITLAAAVPVLTELTKPRGPETVPVASF